MRKILITLSAGLLMAVCGACSDEPKPVSVMDEWQRNWASSNVRTSV